MNDELVQLRQKLRSKAALDPRLRRIRNLIDSGKATFKDTSEYSQIYSEILGSLLSGCVLSLKDREAVCQAMLRESHEVMNDMLAQVQRSLDEKIRLHIQPQKPAFPAERVQQFAHSLSDPSVPDETIQRRAENGAANISASFHDDYTQENAKLRSKAGLKCYILRQTNGSCCKWCSAMAGKYVYGEEPQDVYRRHDNCTCTVTYINGRERQDVLSKRKWSAPVFASEPKAPVRFDSSNRPKGFSPTVLTNGADGGRINIGRNMSAYNQTPPDFNKYPISDNQKAVVQTRKTVAESLGLDINDIDFSGIRNAEVLEPFMKRFIKIKEDTGMTFPPIQAVEVIDGDSCCIASFKPYENRFYISSRFFNNKQLLEETLKEWANNGVLPKQAKSIRYLAEHEAAHIRIPDSLLRTDEAALIFNQFQKTKYANENDENIYEFFADSIAWFRISPNTIPTKMKEAVELLEKGTKE